MLKSKQLVTTAIVSITILLTISTVFSNPDFLEAYAGITLERDNVAKTILVRVNPTGTNIENTFDSFSRIGFVQGEGNFLLESVPSKDKKPFYKLVQKSLETKNSNLKNKGLNISIDIFSGDGEIIETLKYNNCDITEYFVHGVDSKGKIFFTEEDGTVEIREVTKFECISFSLEVEITDEDISQLEKTLDIVDTNQFELIEDRFFSSAPKDAEEGELFYNSITNKLQKFVNGNWTDISGVGGPPSPRR
jgi:hypothetical protein